jgi:hypothetical protein
MSQNENNYFNPHLKYCKDCGVNFLNIVPNTVYMVNVDPYKLKRVAVCCKICKQFCHWISCDQYNKLVSMPKKYDKNKKTEKIEINNL